MKLELTIPTKVVYRLFSISLRKNSWKNFYWDVWGFPVYIKEWALEPTSWGVWITHSIAITARILTRLAGSVRPPLLTTKKTPIIIQRQVEDGKVEITPYFFRIFGNQCFRMGISRLTLSLAYLEYSWMKLQVRTSPVRPLRTRSGKEQPSKWVDQVFISVIIHLCCVYLKFLLLSWTNKFSISLTL